MNWINIVHKIIYGRLVPVKIFPAVKPWYEFTYSVYPKDAQERLLWNSSSHVMSYVGSNKMRMFAVSKTTKEQQWH